MAAAAPVALGQEAALNFPPARVGAERRFLAALGLSPEMASRARPPMSRGTVLAGVGGYVHGCDQPFTKIETGFLM